jgi:hypothetical protein
MKRLSDVKSAEERRFLILEGIREGLSYPEIAAGIGVDRFQVMSDVRTMHYNRDPMLKQAQLDRDKRVKASKATLDGVGEERFNSMIGMSVQEKNFQNMVSFYRPELMKILQSGDEGVAIMGLAKSVQKILVHNEIIGGRKSNRRISLKAREVLPKIHAGSAIE